MKSVKKPSFEDLSQLLQTVAFRLSRDGTSLVMVAAPTMAAMKKQDLPDYVCVTPNKKRGKRVPTRRALGADSGRYDIARWPQAGMSEYRVPILSFIVSGQADLRAADYFLHCQTGDIVLFPSGIPKDNGGKSHLTGEMRERSCDVLWIRSLPSMGLGCYVCQSREEQHISNVPGKMCFTANLFLENLFEGFCEELQKRGNGILSGEMLSLLISLLKRDIDEGMAQAFPYTDPEASELPGRGHHPMDKACVYINSHLKYRLTIETVARHVYLAPTQFTRDFREHTGMTFHEYLTAQRLGKATELLRETNMNIQETCIYVGIKSNQLRNLFQKKYGLSPSQFRKRNGDNPEPRK